MTDYNNSSSSSNKKTLVSSNFTKDTNQNSLTEEHHREFSSAQNTLPKTPVSISPTSPDKGEIMSSFYELDNFSYPGNTTIKEVLCDNSDDFSRQQERVQDTIEKTEPLIEQVEKYSEEVKNAKKQLDNNCNRARIAIKEKFEVDLRKLKENYNNIMKDLDQSYTCQNRELSEKEEKVNLNIASLLSIKSRLDDLKLNSPNTCYITENLPDVISNLEQIRSELEESGRISLENFDFTPSDESPVLGDLHVYNVNSVKDDWVMVRSNNGLNAKNISFLFDKEIKEKITVAHAYDRTLYFATSKNLYSIQLLDKHSDDQPKHIWSGQVQQLTHDLLGLVIIDGGNNKVIQLRQTDSQRREVLIAIMTKPYGLSYSLAKNYVLITDKVDNSVSCYSECIQRWKSASSDSRYINPTDIACIDTVAIVRSRNNLSILSLHDGTYLKTVESTNLLVSNSTFCDQFFLLDNSDCSLSLYDTNHIRSREILTREDNISNQILVTIDMKEQVLYAFKKRSKRIKAFTI